MAVGATRRKTCSRPARPRSCSSRPATAGSIPAASKFRWGEAMLPYDPEVIAEPNNSIIGGASLWTMTAPDRSDAEYKGVAQLLAFIAQPEQVAEWHKRPGICRFPPRATNFPRSRAGTSRTPARICRSSNSPAATLTENSMGLRLGRLPEIRTILEEEVERALQGQQTAQQALDTAVSAATRCFATSRDRCGRERRRQRPFADGTSNDFPRTAAAGRAGRAAVAAHGSCSSSGPPRRRAG